MNGTPRIPLTLFWIVALAGQLLPAQEARFFDATESVGLSSFLSSTGDGHAPGAIFADLNGDDYPDIYMVKAYGGGNGLFLNSAAGSQRTFVRAQNDAGAGDRGRATGAIAGDYDNDGDQDLFVVNFNQPNALYQNRLSETGTFSYVNRTAETDPTPGVDDNQFGVATAVHAASHLDYSLTAAWGDPDRDGDLDLYVGNHDHFYGDAGLDPGQIPGQRDIFYQNNGDGTFTDRTMQYGVPGYETADGAHETPIQHFSSTNAVIFADFNNDRWPDLLVTNKVGGPDDRDMLYINQGADDSGQWLGYETVTYKLKTKFGHRTGGAMGVVVGDAENDGDLDIYVTDWSEPDDFPRNGKNDTWINDFSDNGELDFVHREDLPALYSWGTQWEDFDNNGYQDVHVATQGGAADFLYMNSPDGFSNDSAADAGVAQKENSRGAVSADYNGDGWIDLLVINPYDQRSVLYENRSSSINPDHHGLTLKLEGDPTLPGSFRSTRDAIGARAIVTADLDGDGKIEPGEQMIREVASGTSNAASTSSLDLEFGLGLATEAMVRILWPSGHESSFQVSADQRLTIREMPGHGGDLNSDGRLDASDIDQLSDALRQATSDPRFDLNFDGQIDAADREYWVSVESFTFFGDSNLDGEFNSGDLVTVFAAGRYETGAPAQWSEGDWDGNGSFESGDLVTAFRSGAYETGPRAAAVPEPSTACVLLLTWLVIGLGVRATVSQRLRRSWL